MIDQYGNKIEPTKASADPRFVLKELHFLLKIFRRSPSLSTANQAGERLEMLVKESDIPTEELLEILFELETFTAKTHDGNFLWHMIDCRRGFSRRALNCKNYEDAANHRWHSSLHFETMSKGTPSVFNRSAWVIELIVTSYAYENAKLLKTAHNCIENAVNIFEAIEENDQSTYYRAGDALYWAILYYRLWKCTTTGTKLESYLKAVDFSCKYYSVSKNNSCLRRGADGYLFAFLEPGFDFDREKPRIDQLVQWLKVASEEGDQEMKKTLEKFEKAIALLVEFKAPSE